mmetsp:Transcript_34770/g.86748  ORF Transcript_34770/g.86748 Transcript_34770/m.86748 type:complete len:350 (-) Transcript_34770:280-1329(-)
MAECRCLSRASRTLNSSRLRPARSAAFAARASSRASSRARSRSSTLRLLSSTAFSRARSAASLSSCLASFCETRSVRSTCRSTLPTNSVSQRSTTARVLSSCRSSRSRALAFDAASPAPTPPPPPPAAPKLTSNTLSLSNPGGYRVASHLPAVSISDRPICAGAGSAGRQLRSNLALRVSARVSTPTAAAAVSSSPSAKTLSGPCTLSPCSARGSRASSANMSSQLPKPCLMIPAKRASSSTKLHTGDAPPAAGGGTAPPGSVIGGRKPREGVFGARSGKPASFAASVAARNLCMSTSCAVSCRALRPSRVSNQATAPITGACTPTGSPSSVVAVSPLPTSVGIAPARR